MEKVYLVCWENGEPYEDYHWCVMSVHKSEESAKKHIDTLNEELKKDRERFSYLEEHIELVFDVKGELRDTPEALEFDALYDDEGVWCPNGRYYVHPRNFELYG